MQALKRYPFAVRRAKAREWQSLGVSARQKLRAEAGVDSNTLYHRAMDDRRGKTIRHGVTYSRDNTEGVTWEIRHSVAGRTDQVDLIKGGEIIATGALRPLLRAMARQIL